MRLNFDTVDVLLSNVDLGREHPVIDLSDVDFIEPFAIIYLGMFIRYHNTQGQVFDVVQPTGSALAHLARIRFWERFNFDADTIQRAAELTRPSLASWDDVYDVPRTPEASDEIMAEAQNLLRNGGANVDGAAVAEAILELVDNFALHSGTSLGACFLQHYPHGRSVHFAIGDHGIGIRESLVGNPAHADLRNQPHMNAIAKAFDPLVSRRREGGLGLTNVAEMVGRLGGRMILVSGDGYVRILGNRRMAGTMALDLPGVQVEISFPAGVPHANP